MQIEEYINNIPDERREAFIFLREKICQNLPTGFLECMNYNMVGYVVPHSLYPNGYHCNPKLPLPFASIASQKNSINFYHMGIYNSLELKNWFMEEYKKSFHFKLDMGKSCIRFSKADKIPFDLIGQLMSKISAKQWIETYESTFLKR